ncbi:MAG: hypothetical protein KAS75_04715 [Planctomycetes bacterium]|nr:hypothetical protein [Planctomycetota bacterium]
MRRVKKVADAVGRPESAKGNHRTPQYYRNSPVLANLFHKIAPSRTLQQNTAKRKMRHRKE